MFIGEYNKKLAYINKKQYLCGVFYTMKVFLFSLERECRRYRCTDGSAISSGETNGFTLSFKTNRRTGAGRPKIFYKHIMKSFIKLFAIALVAMTMASCNETVEETFVYSVSNATILTNSDLLSVMSYAESKVKMSTASVMTFTGTQAEADKQAKAEFANRLKAIDEQEFCAMIAKGDYYDFILYRASTEQGKSEEIDRKHYEGAR